MGRDEKLTSVKQPFIDLNDDYSDNNKVGNEINKERQKEDLRRSVDMVEYRSEATREKRRKVRFHMRWYEKIPGRKTGIVQ